MKKILIKNGTLVGNGFHSKNDILIENNRIVAIAENIDCDADTETFDATDCIVTYGLADVHVHLREPGFSAKETIETGTKAAAHGGFTTVCSMPNLIPAPDAIETLAQEEKLIEKQAVIEVLPFATISKERKGHCVVEIETLHTRVAGFSDDGNGIQNAEIMQKAMQKVAAVDSIIAAHCEENSLLNNGYIHKGEYAEKHHHRGICSESEYLQIERDIEMALEQNCRYHVCHISTAESVDIIRKAKNISNKISCETAPHYLTLCDDDLQEDGRFKMNPPLRSKNDKKALIEGIKDGTIEVIATDHAPHTQQEKSLGLKGSAMGIVGLATAFAVCYTKLVRTGIIDIKKLIALMCDNPRRIFHLGGTLQVGQRADIAVFDIKNPYLVDSKTFLSKGKATPFENWEVYGKCLLTIYNGKVVWKE